jgi:MFS family permease
MSTRIHWTPIGLLQVPNLLSGVSNGVVTIAVPWLVLDITGSVANAGIVAAISALPGILASPLAGWAVDHFGRRIVSIVSDLLSAISVAAIPLVALATDLNVAWIIGLAMLGAVFDPAGYTARKALIPDVAAASGMDMNRLNGIHEGVFGVGWVIGPLVGSLLIATLGPTSAFWVPCGLFLIAAYLIGLLRVSDAGQEAKAAREEAGETHPSAWGNAVLGVTIIWRDPALRALVIAVTVLGSIYLPTETVLLPAHFVAIDQPQSLGIVLAALSGGTLVGAFGYGWISRRMSRLAISRTALIATFVCYLPIALLPALPIMVLAGFALGLAWGPMQPLMNTVVQRRVPADAQGRVYGIQTSLFYAMPPAFMLATGVAAERVGVMPVLLTLAALMTVVGVSILFVRSFREVND